MRKTRLERLLADEHIAVVESIVAYLRSRAPRLVPTAEISVTCGRSKAQVYGLLKKGRELLSLTTGEFIPNTAKRRNNLPHGYTVTFNPRAALYEATKSFDRADGHLSQGVLTQGRVPEAAMKTPEDAKLWLATKHRAKAARFFLEASDEARTVEALDSNNRRLSLASREEAATPWEVVGLTNHHHHVDDDHEDSDA